MRNTDDLAALEHIATAISTLPDIAYVRSITRPAGKPLTETTTGYQAGVIGKRLEEAQQRIAQSRPDLGRLASGLAQLQGGADTAAANAPRLVAGTRQVVELARTIISSYESAGQALSTATNSTADIPQTLADLTGLVDVLDRSLQALSANAFTADAVNTPRIGARSRTDSRTDSGMHHQPDLRTRPGAARRTRLDLQRRHYPGAATIPGVDGRPQEGIQSARLALPRVKDALARLNRCPSNSEVNRRRKFANSWTNWSRERRHSLKEYRDSPAASPRSRAASIKSPVSPVNSTTGWRKPRATSITSARIPPPVLGPAFIYRHKASPTNSLSPGRNCCSLPTARPPGCSWYSTSNPTAIGH